MAYPICKDFPYASIVGLVLEKTQKAVSIYQHTKVNFDRNHLQENAGIQVRRGQMVVKDREALRRLCNSQGSASIP